VRCAVSIPLCGELSQEMSPVSGSAETCHGSPGPGQTVLLYSPEPF
jgi:hypothetical protein